MSLFAFIFLLAVIVAVHEFGHFVAARALGVAVEEFSVGLGPLLFQRSIGDTRFALRAFPVGGYLRMRGERARTQTGTEESEVDTRSLSAQSLPRRLLIFSAGSLANLLLAALTYFAVGFARNQVLPARIGEVVPHGPADGLLDSGDLILAINGAEVSSFEEVANLVAGSDGRFALVRVQRSEQVRNIRVPLENDIAIESFFSQPSVRKRILIRPGQTESMIGVRTRSESGQPSAAQLAGLRTFDRVLAVAGQPTPTFASLVETIGRARPGAIALTVASSEGVWWRSPLLTLHALRAHLLTLDVRSPRIAHPTRQEAEQRLNGLGIERSDLYVSAVDAQSTVAHSLRIGDRLALLDGEPVYSIEQFLLRARARQTEAHRIEVLRDAETVSFDAHFGQAEPDREHGRLVPWLHLGFSTGVSYTEPNTVPADSRLTRAIVQSIDSFRTAIRYCAVGLSLFATAQLSLSSLRGPIATFRAAREASEDGLTHFLSLLGFVSTNIAIVNLLPIPLLDGGLIGLAVLGRVRRRELNENEELWMRRLGFAILATLFLITLVNDLTASS